VRIPFSRLAVAFALVGGAAVAGASSGGAVAPTSPPSWTSQLGTSDVDKVTSVSATRSGDVYVGGTTQGSLGGTNLAPTVLDGFVARYDKNGTRKWIHQVGTALEDGITDIAATPTGDVYAVGTTSGSLSALAGEGNQGGQDNFVAKYDKNGNRKWIHQFGTAGYDQVSSVAVTASGDVYLTGFTSGSLSAAPGESAQGDFDVFVARYDKKGNRKWLHQFGTGSEDIAQSIAVTPNGTSYVVGHTYGNPTADTPEGDLEGYVASYDRNGNRRWIHLVTTSGIDDALAVTATSAGDVYVGGSTTGVFNESVVGLKDVYIARYDTAGTRTWVHQFGTENYDNVTDLAATSNGDVYLAGITTGSLNETNPSPGSFDLFVSRFTRVGDRAWVRQFGTASDDFMTSATVTPGGDLYVGGYTDGSIGTSPSSGGTDGFFTKFAAARNARWLHTLSTSGYDAGNAVASTAAGDLYVVGQTTGNLAPGGGSSTDVFLAKYDKNGNQKWIRQFGTAAGDAGQAVAVTARGDVYISGYTYGALVPGGSTSGDAFVAKYDRNGNQKWVRQFGSTDFDDGATGVAVDGRGNVYVSGYSEGSLFETNPNPGVYDAIIAKYDKSGNRKWVHQLGTSGSDYAVALAVTTAGDAYVGGYSDGALAPSDGSGQDAFIAKYDKNGNQKWVRQFGTSGTEVLFALAIGRSGSVVAAGSTNGVLAPASPLLGSGTDGFLANYDKNGNRKWVQQFGSAQTDQMIALAVTSNGDTYVAGLTNGVTPGEESAGKFDVAVARFDRNGSLIWGHQFGSAEDDNALGISVSAKGGITVVGSARARLNEPALGNADAYITRLPY
jgi:hypothetical protein